MHDPETEPTPENKSDTLEVEMPDTSQQPDDPVKDGATRKLPVESVVSANNARMVFGQASDIGQIRDHNEDSILSFVFTCDSVDDLSDMGLFIVADGMGGHEDGDRASALAIRSIADTILQDVFLNMLSSGAERASMPPLAETIMEALEKANNAIYDELGGRGGTTCTAALVFRNRVYIGHVGDSRAYLITKNEIEQITRDHSMAQRLVEVGQMTSEEAKNSENNTLYRTMGVTRKLDADLVNRRLPARSYLLICSDGLWNFVDDDTLAKVVHDILDPQDACDHLVAQANVAGGKDNISVILVAIS